MLLIEAIVYAAMLSMLLVGFIRFSYDLHLQDIKLIQTIQDEQSR